MLLFSIFSIPPIVFSNGYVYAVFKNLQAWLAISKMKLDINENLCI